MSDKKISLEEKLLNIQTKLKAPKNQFNSFSNFNYRSCEDIVEAVKPLLKEEKLLLKISDEIVLVGSRYYVKTTALLTDIESKEDHIISLAYAREEESKKGMDGSQITGASSSYARKYALNGLFLIDDTKDSDSMDNTKKEAQKPTQKQAEGDLVCSNCGNPINEAISNYSLKMYSKNLCMECQKLAKEGKDDNNP